MQESFKHTNALFSVGERERRIERVRNGKSVKTVGRKKKCVDVCVCFTDRWERGSSLSQICQM